MFFDLLHFGSGLQAIHYFIFCFVAILGAIQYAAAHSHRRDLLWFEGQAGYGLGALMIVGGYVWFFITDEEIFIPGLAGGELFALFVAAFIAALPTARAVTFALERVRAFSATPARPARKKEPIA